MGTKITGVNMTRDGTFDARVGFMRERYYLGTYLEEADAISAVRIFRTNAHSRYQVGGSLAVKELAEELFDLSRSTRATQPTPKRTMTRLDELEQRVQTLEAQVDALTCGQLQ